MLTEPVFRFPVKGNIYTVHDGDTIKIPDLDRAWGDRRETGLRVYGVDAPEKSTRKNLLERKAGGLVKQVTALWCSRQDHSLQVFASSEVKSKYEGRTIGRFYFGPLENGARDLGTFLLGGGFVRPYMGGRRHEWEDAELDVIIEAAEAYLAS